MACIINAEENAVVVAIIIVFVLLFFGAFSFYVNVIVPFLDERKYIKAEMETSEGEEYKYWKNELKFLYLRHIPIIGRFWR